MPKAKPPTPRKTVRVEENGISEGHPDWSPDKKNQPGQRQAPAVLTKGVVVTLWNLTKKYEVALKQREVFAVKESEIDREEVADAYNFLETPWERVLDGRFYKTLAMMQHRRDAVTVTPETTPEEWIAGFAGEVKRRATPLVFLTSPEATLPTLALPQEETPIASSAPPTANDRAALARYQVAFEQVPIGKLDDLRTRLITRLRGKQLTLAELSASLTNWELDLLSQLIRDGDLPAVFVDRATLAFRRPKPQSPEDVAFAAAAVEVRNREKVQKA
jgi:hypothetical protein